MRRSRRNGHPRRTSSIRARSTSAIRIASRSCGASATTAPNGSARNDEPQNSIPSPDPPPLTRMPVLSFPLSALRRGGQGVRSGPLVAHAVHRGDVTAVGDGVAALDGAPGVELLGAVGRLLLRVPADGCRITEEGGALQRGETRALRIPLIPAH